MRAAPTSRGQVLYAQLLAEARREARVNRWWYLGIGEARSVGLSAPSVLGVIGIAVTAFSPGWSKYFGVTLVLAGVFVGMWRVTQQHYSEEKIFLRKAEKAGLDLSMGRELYRRRSSEGEIVA